MAEIKKLTGSNAFSYAGVDPLSPPDVVSYDRTPTPDDYNFNIGTLWLETEHPEQVWMLADKVGTVAHWVPLYASAGQNAGADTFETNNGTATSSNGALNFSGDEPISTRVDGNTIVIELDNGTGGQVLIGGGTEPTWQSITSSDNSVIITEGPNSIDLSIPTAPPSGATVYNTNSGEANPDGSQELEFLGKNVITTSGTGNTISVGLTPGTDGQLIIGGGDDPAWSSITSAGNTIGITTGPNTLNLEALTTNSGPLMSSPTPAQINAIGSVAFSAYVPGNTYSIPSPPAGQVSYLGVGTPLVIDFNYGNGFSPGGVTEAQFVAPMDGIYMFGATINFITLGTYTFIISKNDIERYVLDASPLSSLNTETSDNLCQVFQLAAGDIIRFGSPRGVSIRGFVNNVRYSMVFGFLYIKL